MEKKSFMQFLDEFEERFLVVEKQSKDKKVEKKEEKKEEKKPVKKVVKKVEKKEEKKEEKKVEESVTLVDRAYDILDGITDNSINLRSVIGEGQVPAQVQVVETTADHAADLL